MRGSIKIGTKCELCGLRYGMYVQVGQSEAKCKCGGRLIPDKEAKDVITNFVCPNCDSSFGMIVGTDICPNCKTVIE